MGAGQGDCCLSRTLMRCAEGMPRPYCPPCPPCPPCLQASGVSVTRCGTSTPGPLPQVRSLPARLPACLRACFMCAPVSGVLPSRLCHSVAFYIDRQCLPCPACSGLPACLPACHACRLGLQGWAGLHRQSCSAHDRFRLGAPVARQLENVSARAEQGQGNRQASCMALSSS